MSPRLLFSPGSNCVAVTYLPPLFLSLWCVHVSLLVCMHACGSQRMLLHVFLYCSPSHCVRQSPTRRGAPPDVELVNSARLADHQALGLPCLFFRAGVTAGDNTPSFVLLFVLGAGDPNSSLLACVAKT